MPYYYSLFLKFFGISFLSAGIGQCVLLFICQLMVYLTLSLTIAPALAFLASIWFLIFYNNIIITYNHIGGVTVLLAITYCLFLYLKEQKFKYQISGYILIGLLCLIKINFGLVALIVFLFSSHLINRTLSHSWSAQNKKIQISLILSILLLTFLIYYFLLRGLPLYAIRQCLPYLSADQPYNISPIDSLSSLLASIFKNIFSDISNFSFAVIILACLVQTAVAIKTKQLAGKTRDLFLLSVIILSIFYTANLHEFLLSGVIYRYWWATPFSILLIFIIIGKAIESLNKIVRLLIYSMLIFLIAVSLLNMTTSFRQTKNPNQYFSQDKGKIYIGNDLDWQNTVNQTINFLKHNLAKDELFFAAPYDPLYYFLTGKDSPTRQLIFFEHINIPSEQEKEIIADLEKKQVNWIVLSSRMNSAEPGLGTLGLTYCPLIGKYIKENFEAVVQFGDWMHPPGWAWNHGTAILKRKIPI